MNTVARINHPANFASAADYKTFLNQEIERKSQRLQLYRSVLFSADSKGEKQITPFFNKQLNLVQHARRQSLPQGLHGAPTNEKIHSIEGSTSHRFMVRCVLNQVQAYNDVAARIGFETVDPDAFYQEHNAERQKSIDERKKRKVDEPVDGTADSNADSNAKPKKRKRVEKSDKSDKGEKGEKNEKSKKDKTNDA